MLEEVLSFLKPGRGNYFIDCTLGGAGYSLAIAEKTGEGRVLSIDLDEAAIKNASQIIKTRGIKNVTLIHDNFKNLSKIVKNAFTAKEKSKLAGIVFDLGLSTAQLEDQSRGFSFRADAPLKMNFDRSATSLNAAVILNNWRQDELEKIIKEYGEEKFAKIIARRIVQVRRKEKITTTGQLIKIIKNSLPARHTATGRIHFATKTFQALRIAVNQELENLKEVLPQALELLNPGGRLVTVSYHSLEDRIVKRFLKEESKDCLCPPSYPLCRCGHQAKLKILTAKPLGPGDQELAKNPRARSAKLRAAEKI